MLSHWLSALQRLNDPDVIGLAGFAYIAAYYFTVYLFHLANDSDQTGWFEKTFVKNGIVDIATSVVWFIGGAILFASLIGLLVQKQLSLGYLLIYYLHFLFIFAFFYSIMEWHWEGSLSEMPKSWKGEVHSVVLSIQVMTGSSLTSTFPKRLRAQMVAALQSLLGLLFVAIFIAKAVNRIADT